ncbi:carbon-phosphorus lyase complex subunit PhnI [Paenibacillus macquariensis]|uniref:Alpha-D-ribose 1-methylphosphonate 5-triphosphate synthase subunit PhnI n=1 Tax=Paenibacillus macquariensis TaxID=948756 RepID=A0ABY1K4U8_9BACL|nr:carbon-phosphorus lyase complex subunit PhnI [Paenibacillus macquariensis]MEC0089069.1 carbon-phosphorus lyase complex subunit PhnI [Paenibacillus macquariensis]OAB31808.1 carbon-phosphorus lyase [Paenibacillus macquariensis subsp. macquariensis]SIR25517.1 alpha-D-ribose 1-methylphosphonate 5-triphosphate synthase subunit PhnI [Paenibacillus macquariensis]
MAYVAVRGGQQAIKEAEKLLHYYRLKDGEQPITINQIRTQMRLAVDKAMSEGSLYDPDLAALALKQAEGDAIEASFLLRAFRSTLPRQAYTDAIDTSKMEIVRRISATFKEVPGGQYLGPTRDYTKRLLRMELMEETEAEAKATISEFLENLNLNAEEVESGQVPTFPRVINLLKEEGLIHVPTQGERNTDGSVDDITRDALSFPTSRAVRLQAMTRGETGALLAFAYSSVRGYGDVHPTIGELRVGYVPVYMPHPIYPEETIALGRILVTEAEIVVRQQDENVSGAAQFAVGYGLCFGHNEDKAISMGILDQTMVAENPASPAQDEEFVLYHIDGIESSGFISHFKLPHYVDFQAELQRVRSINRKEENEV